ncbi:hypothetical protein CRV01_01540 [Arcobacter sp. CECT 8983]|uniref:hypothetical protein n=1 Tax=Arcobacter sp. CECT 8983 TaxID=2044508 RepID=UPI00100B66A9|nr:hypothetical protein [Arcobacter sp. CECT 8983]RXJ91801.1 hypothetical protein CRV01_01540 [Arcobacter sp. CECT 8983]
MTNLNYENHLKDKNLDIKKEYLASLNKSKFDSKNGESLEDRYKRYIKTTGTLKDVFKDYSLEDIVLVKTDSLKDIVADIEYKISKITEKKKKNLYQKVKDLFKYENKFQGDVITPFFTDNFNFRTCFYCNKDFITNFEKQKGVYTSTFQLDHFYDKGTYPYLALSFCNLIPSCATCNSRKVKGSVNMINTITPNSEDFKFHEKVKFKLYLDKNCKDLHVKDKDDIDISLKEQFSKEYKKYIEVFKLNERYKAHKDIVYEMIEKAELYPDSRLKELQDITGIPYQQIKKDIFNLIEEDEDLSKKPFSKLIKDISEELGLV